MTGGDTPTEARQCQLAAFAALTGPERVVLAAAMAEEAKTVAIAGIRSRHPDLDDDAVQRAWLCLLHGEELVIRACGPGSTP